MKTKLKITISNGQASVTPYNVYRVQKEDKIVYSRVKVCELPIITDSTQGQYTEYFTAVLDKYVPMLVYVGLRTIYTKNPNDKIDKLMSECKHYARKMTGCRREEFEQYVADIDSRTYTTTEIHTYKMDKDSNGKRHRVEIVPWEERKLSDFGKTILNEEELPTGMDVEDVIQEAYVGMLELCNVGVINSLYDFWTYKNVVYACINRYIDRQKSINKRNRDIDPWMIKNECKSDSRQEKMILNAEKKEARKQVVELLRVVLAMNLGSKINVQDALTVFDYYFGVGLSTLQIAERMGKGKTHVVRYMSHIKNALHDEKVHELITELTQ